MLEHTLLDFIQEVYPEIEIDEPTEEDCDNHTITQLEELNLDRFAALPEAE